MISVSDKMEQPPGHKTTNLKTQQKTSGHLQIILHMGYTCHFVIKHKEALMAIGQSDSNLAVQFLFLLLGSNPACNSLAVYSLLYHLMIT